jgi:hypothetical protein
MSVYTVHEPPLRAADALAEPERFVFVRDGFYVWAFLLTPLWLLWRRLWLVFISYAVLSAVLDGALRLAGVSVLAIALVGVLISLLIGLEAATLQRLTLRRRGWRNVGVVSGADIEDAEQRFFDAWLRQAPARNAPPSATTPPAAPASSYATTFASAFPPAHASDATGVIGLFPEPGA